MDSPSLSPLSTFRACLTRCGTRLLETTACPSAASVGASTAAIIAASQNSISVRSSAPTAVPSAIVSGIPTPSSLAGSPRFLLSVPSSILDASANRTITRASSASSSPVSLVSSRSVTPVTSGPSRIPAATKNIGALTSSDSSRRETRL